MLYTGQTKYLIVGCIMKSLLALCLLLLCSGSVMAETKYSDLPVHEPEIVTYLCIEEASGGLKHNKNTNTWEGVKYKPSGKYLVKVDIAGEYRHTATVTDFGDKEPRFTCKENYTNGGRYHCDKSFEQFIFSQKTLRYVKSSMIGYVIDWGENNDSTPHIQGGTCSPL